MRWAASRRRLVLQSRTSPIWAPALGRLADMESTRCNPSYNPQVLQEMADEADASDEEAAQPEVDLVGPPVDPRVKEAVSRMQGPPSQLEASFKVGT